MKSTVVSCQVMCKHSMSEGKWWLTSGVSFSARRRVVRDAERGRHDKVTSKHDKVVLMQQGFDDLQISHSRPCRRIIHRQS